MFPKPPRSKHCSLCRACVARSDHHCIWVNNCLGRGNYKHFLALLLTTSILLAYGAYLAYATLKPQIEAHFAAYPGWHGSDYAGRTDWWGMVVCKLDTWLDVLTTAFDVGGVCRGGVGFLALLTAPLPAGLLAYHLYLVWAGTTTNESGKWGDWKEDVEDDLVWSTEVYQHGQEYKQPWVKWPKRSETFLVLTNDGREPRLVAEEITRVIVGGDKASWRRVRSMKELVNIYDLGLWENILESLN
jgi:palmitoyltransferase ZDHHC4